MIIAWVSAILRLQLPHNTAQTKTTVVKEPKGMPRSKPFLPWAWNSHAAGDFVEVTYCIIEPALEEARTNQRTCQHVKFQKQLFFGSPSYSFVGRIGLFFPCQVRSRTSKSSYNISQKPWTRSRKHGRRLEIILHIFQIALAWVTFSSRFTDRIHPALVNLKMPSKITTTTKLVIQEF